MSRFLTLMYKALNTNHKLVYKGRWGKVDKLGGDALFA